MDLAYCAIFGFDMFGPLDRTETHDLVGIDGSWIGVTDTPNSRTLGRGGDDCTEFGSQPASVATSPALMDHLTVGPVESQAPASSASSMAQPVSARRRHRPASTTNTTSTDAQEEHPRAVSAVEDGEGHPGISIGYDERHRAAPTPELHSSLVHDIGHVVRSHCLMQWKS
ncbi:unnamed protein product [Prunus armeniaca]